jgi:DNA-binding NarL/FixJ family response regulator
MLFARLIRRWATGTFLVAKGGRSGLQTAIDRRPRMVVVEAHLDDTEGEMLVGALRNGVMPPDEPIVVLAHDGTPSERGRFLRVGARAYVATPSDDDEFDRTVSILFEVAAWR